MNVFINHAPVEIEAAMSLTDLLLRENIRTDGIAIAIQNKVVPRSEWEEIRLQENAKITIIQAVCGG